MRTEGQVGRGYHHNEHPDLPTSDTGQQPRRTPRPTTAPWPVKRQPQAGDRPGRKQGSLP